MENKEISDGVLPRIGITIGDAAGIGPEITLKALTDGEINKICQPILFGDAGQLIKLAHHFKYQLEFETIKIGEKIPSYSEKTIIYDLGNLPDKVAFGIETELTGKASAQNIETAVKLCLEKEIDALATAPISKKALSMAGYSFPGHTEMLAHLTNTERFAMSFFAGKLCVVLHSTHVSLAKAISLVKTESLVKLIVFTNQALEKLLKKPIKIAVAGLNPHASEDGMFGNEEQEIIKPAVEECQKKLGINVSGPYSPDTIFLRGYRGEFDSVISCYHDQATIAVKCLSFGESVNVTLGLPIIRTSVDHGTAFDIAGKNIADCSSMKAAIRLAAELARLKY